MKKTMSHLEWDRERRGDGESAPGDWKAAKSAEAPSDHAAPTLEIRKHASTLHLCLHQTGLLKRVLNKGTEQRDWSFTPFVQSGRT